MAEIAIYIHIYSQTQVYILAYTHVNKCSLVNLIHINKFIIQIIKKIGMRLALEQKPTYVLIPSEFLVA